jgi:Ion channel
MQDSPVIFVLCFSFTFCMVLAKINQLIEAPMQRLAGNPYDHYSFTNCIYQILIVMTTVGYGDITNSTLAGKLLIFITAIFGIIMVSFFVTVITKKLDMKPSDSRSFSLINRLAMKKRIQKQAGSILCLFFRLARLHMRKQVDAMHFLAAEMKIKLATLRVLRREYNALVPEIQVNEDIFLQFERLQTGQKQALIALNNLSKLAMTRKQTDQQELAKESAEMKILHHMVSPTQIQAEFARQVDKARVVPRFDSETDGWRA